MQATIGKNEKDIKTRLVLKNEGGIYQGPKILSVAEKVGVEKYQQLNKGIVRPNFLELFKNKDEGLPVVDVLDEIKFLVLNGFLHFPLEDNMKLS